MVIAAFMDIGFGSSALFLLLTGGFAVALFQAVVRRDGPSTLAMGLALVGTAHLAGLPAWLLIWGCTVVAVAIAMSLAGLIIHWIAGGDAYRIGMIGTIAMALMLVVHHQHPLPSATAVIGDRPMAIGNHLHRQVDLLVRG